MKKTLYINYLTLLFCLIAGGKSLYGECFGFFSDRLIHELHFTTPQYSSMTTLYYLSYGIATVVNGTMISRSSKRKAWLLPMTTCVGIIAVLTTFMKSYPGFALCRLLAGVFTGSSQAIMLNIVAKNLVRQDYGTRNGIISSVSSIISSVIGPFLFAWIADTTIWNRAFLLIGCDLLLCALLLQFTVSEVQCEKVNSHGNINSLFESFHELFQNKAFVMLLVIGLAETTANLTNSVFLPLYFSEICGMNTNTKAIFLSLKGLSYIPLTFLAPVLTDKKGLRPALILIFLCSAVSPITAFLSPGNMYTVYLVAIFGAFANASVALYSYVAPRQILPERLYMQGSGIILGCSVLLGGSLAPQLMSLLVDAGLRIEYVLGINGLIFIICSIISTNPIFAKN